MSKRSQPMGYYLFFLAMCFYGYEYFLRIIPAIVQADWMVFFHMDATLFATISAFYFYAYTPLQLVAGIVSDRYHPRYVLGVCVFLCVLGTLGIAFANQYHWVAVGRLLQGIGSAFAFVGLIKVIALYFPARYFAVYSGVAQSIGFMAAGVGMLMLHCLSQQIDWHGLFRLFAGVGALLLLAFMVTWQSRFDVKQKVVCQQPETFSAYGAALWQLCRLPQIWIAGGIAALVFLPTSVFAALWGIPYLIATHGFSQGEAASGVAMIFFGWSVGTPLVGWLSDYWQRRAVLIRWGAGVACLLSLVVLYDLSLPVFWVDVGLFLLGVLSAVEMLCFVIARDYSPAASVIATATALMNAFAMLGGLFFQRIVGQMLDYTYVHSATHLLHRGVRVYAAHDYQWAMRILPLAFLLACVLSFFSRDRIPTSGRHASR